MFKREPNLYLEDILASIFRIEEYTKDLSYETFCKDQLTIDAVVRNFEILGEAIKNLPKEFKEQHSDVPWKKAIGMRNRIIHDYFNVDLLIIWESVKEDIPEVGKIVAKVVNELKIKPKDPEAKKALKKLT